MNPILSAMKHWANTTPEKYAFIGQNANGGVESINYRELMVRVTQAGDFLRSLNAQCVALKAENSLAWMIIDLACLYENICMVPVPTFFSASQVQHVLDQSGADVLIGDWPSEGNGGAIEGLKVSTRASSHHNQRLAGTFKITFTSGSTGTPKGVCLSVENLSKVTQSLADSVQVGSSKHMVFLPLSTLLENITGIYVPLMLGVASLIFPGKEIGLSGSSQFDAQRFAQAIATYQPSSLVLTPALLMALIQIVAHQPDLAKSLNFVAVGGARVAAQLIQKAHQLSIPAYEGYGLSECASVVSLNTPAMMKAGTSGQVLNHVQAKVSSDGELWVKGNIALGYLGEPFGDEWLATGDLAELDDGFVTLKGRKKNQIITSFGRNISPEWVESEAQIYLPGCSMIINGEGQEGLTAVVVNRPDLLSGIEQLNLTLPDYAQVKRVVVLTHFTGRNWFTSNGRPKRNEVENWVQTYLSNRDSAATQHNTLTVYRVEASSDVATQC
ncbi:AMP-binding protein [Vibrio rumoiensis]|uniref:AMP-binding protein n=1 Tax=Vibrio rumoiensis TaxID=76258 RepID=A0ABW7IYT2_9VIBR